LPSNDFLLHQHDNVSFVDVNHSGGEAFIILSRRSKLDDILTQRRQPSAMQRL